MQHFISDYIFFEFLIVQLIKKTKNIAINPIQLDVKKIVKIFAIVKRINISKYLIFNCSMNLLEKRRG